MLYISSAVHMCIASGVGNFVGAPMRLITMCEPNRNCVL